MSVPFVTQESNQDAFKKMKVRFLVQKIRRSDVMLFITVIVPIFLNIMWFHLMQGNNNFEAVFCPLGSMFAQRSTSASMKDWASWYGGIQMAIIAVGAGFRIFFSYTLWKNMENYVQKNPDFKWNKKDKFWTMLWLPFVSFVVYPILVKYERFELSHKYNL